MRRAIIQKIRFYALAAAGIAGGLLVLAVFVAWTGLYNIAASRGHWTVVEWFLTFGMRNSVKTYAIGIDTPDLKDPNFIALGAGHFHSGCAICHGAPGVARDPVTLNMLPPPPDLSTSMREWRDREVFWIVKHGIKYTGMPAWPALERDDEVWALTSFLRHLPSLDPARYAALALGDVSVAPQSGQKIATTETASEAAGACARCHGAGGTGPQSNLVPILHGQPAEFLSTALDSFVTGRRSSGIMQAAAANISAAERQRVASYYAGLSPPVRNGSPAISGEALERGRTLALEGAADQRLPACRSCHNPAALNTFPRLEGQNQAYMVNRLHRWQHHANPADPTDAIMAPIAKALTERQLQDVSAYYSAQTPARNAPP